MGEREDLAGNLRQLLELDRGFGIEFQGKGGLTAAAGAARPLPTAIPQTAPVPAIESQPPTAISQPPRSSDDSLPLIAAEIARCRACGLCETRTNTVPGEGSATAELVFVGEGPGADEDAQGRPFVGAAGQLLTKMIEAMGFRRDEVYICNVVKCRPPGNRTPEPGEVEACIGYLHRQLAVLRPKVICTLGNTPLRALMRNDKLGITRLRGQRMDWNGTPLIPTFHPAYLLRNPEGKKPCWDDLKQVLAVLGREAPARK